MKRRQHSFNTFPELDTFIDVFIVLSVIYGIPYLLGYYGCKILFNGSVDDCRAWGSLIMIGIPVICHLIDRILNIFNLYRDEN